jgi:hypothetical protein
MQNTHIINYVAANTENVAEEDCEQKGYYFGNAISSSIFVSPEGINIIKSSLTWEKALEMILPSKSIELDEDNIIDKLLNVHVLVEMARCFELIELREIPGPAPAEWEKINIQAPVMYFMRSHPVKFELESFPCMW